METIVSARTASTTDDLRCCAVRDLIYDDVDSLSPGNTNLEERGGTGQRYALIDVHIKAYLAAEGAKVNANDGHYYKILDCMRDEDGGFYRERRAR